MGRGCRRLFFSPFFFILFSQKNKTVLVKGWRRLSGDLTGPGRKGSVQVEGCFYKVPPRRSLFCYMRSQGMNLTVAAVSNVSSFKGDTSSYDFASLLATLLCHCKLTVGFKAFRGLHSNENSSTAPLCWSIAGHPCLSGLECGVLSYYVFEGLMRNESIAQTSSIRH